MFAFISLHFTSYLWVKVMKVKYKSKWSKHNSESPKQKQKQNKVDPLQDSVLDCLQTPPPRCLSNLGEKT